MIFREWSARIRTAQADEYVRYVEEIGTVISERQR